LKVESYKAERGIYSLKYSLLFAAAVISQDVAAWRKGFVAINSRLRGNDAL